MRENERRKVVEYPRRLDEVKNEEQKRKEVRNIK